MMQIMYCMPGAVKFAYKKLGRKKTLVIYTCTFTLSKVLLLMINIFTQKVYDTPKTNFCSLKAENVTNTFTYIEKFFTFIEKKNPKSFTRKLEKISIEK